jgi:hypothetical protein
MPEPASCLALAKLEAALDDLVSGKAARLVEFQGGDTVRRKVEYHTAPDERRLRRRIAELKAQCDRDKGLTTVRGRHAITFGGRR